MTASNWWLSNMVAEVEQHSTLLRSDLLGATPSELAHHDDILAEQGWPWVGHQGCPEMDLANCFAIGE